MFRFLVDEDFNNNIVRGLLRRNAEIDIVRVQDVGLSGVDDEQILAWAAREDRIVLSHDSSTMSKFAYERVTSGQKMPGVFITPQHVGIGVAVAELDGLIDTSSAVEWADQVTYLPLSR